MGIGGMCCCLNCQKKELQQSLKCSINFNTPIKEIQGNEIINNDFQKNIDDFNDAEQDNQTEKNNNENDSSKKQDNQEETKNEIKKNKIRFYNKDNNTNEIEDDNSEEKAQTVSGIRSENINNSGTKNSESIKNKENEFNVRDSTKHYVL